MSIYIKKVYGFDQQRLINDKHTISALGDQSHIQRTHPCRKTVFSKLVFQYLKYVLRKLNLLTIIKVTAKLVSIVPKDSAYAAKSNDLSKLLSLVFCFTSHTQGLYSLLDFISIHIYGFYIFPRFNS